MGEYSRLVEFQVQAAAARRAKFPGDYENAEQLAMFKSGREIREDYDPWHGDRHAVHENETMQSTDSAGGEETPSGLRVRAETNDEVWDRKNEESDWRMSGDPYDDDKLSLAEHIVKHGVSNPISLQFKDTAPAGGRPQVLGGHHRVAVMSTDKPDEVMPVEYFPTMDHAKSTLKGRY